MKQPDTLFVYTCAKNWSARDAHIDNASDPAWRRGCLAASTRENPQARTKFAASLRAESRSRFRKVENPRSWCAAIRGNEIKHLSQRSAGAPLGVSHPREGAPLQWRACCTAKGRITPASRAFVSNPEPALRAFRKYLSKAGLRVG